MSLRIGLALGGGAALGLAHIGVLKVLSEEGITADCVAGTSAGAVVGAALCAGRSWREIWDAARRLEWSHLVSLTIPRQGMMRLDKLERYVEAITGVRDFSQLRTPFAAVATDLERGEPVVFTTGSVGRAVRASCSVPGLFEPLRVGETALADGGLVNDVPADVVRSLGADIVVAVNLHSRKLQSGPPKNILDIAYYTFDILLAGAGQRGMASADLVVSPDLQGFHYRNLKKADDLVARGEHAMRGALEELRRLIGLGGRRASNG